MILILLNLNDPLDYGSRLECCQTEREVMTSRRFLVGLPCQIVYGKQKFQRLRHYHVRAKLFYFY